MLIDRNLFCVNTENDFWKKIKARNQNLFGKS